MGTTSTSRARPKTAGSTRPSKAPRAVAKRAGSRLGGTSSSQVGVSVGASTAGRGSSSAARSTSAIVTRGSSQPHLSSGNDRVNAEASTSASAQVKPTAKTASSQRTQMTRRSRRRSSSDDHGLSGTSEEDQDSNDDDDNDSMEDLSEDELTVGTNGLQPTLRVVSKATVQKKWKPLTMKTRTHVQSLVAGLFPEVIARVRGENKKIAMQMQLNRLLQKINDRLSGLAVPPPPRDQRTPYAQLAARNRDLETILLPDLDHIGELELRLEQEERMAKQVEEQLAVFQEKKQALDTHTRQLYRSKLHRSLRGPELERIVTSLATEDASYEHLDVNDQQLVMDMPEIQSQAAPSASSNRLYDPSTDPVIQRVSKSLASKLEAVEQNAAQLDSLIQTVSYTQAMMHGLPGFEPLSQQSTLRDS
ncbi:hypothetical protein BGZ73_003085 [Actinomortierella ambigua]|nr:hypothetical protein BGZ73_003085 [Actinomortierella ambigua]